MEEKNKKEKERKALVQHTHGVRRVKLMNQRCSTVVHQAVFNSSEI